MLNAVLYICIYIFLLFLVFYKSRFTGIKKDQINDDCLSLKATQSLKGILALIIVMHHLSLHYAQDRIMLVFMQAGKYAVSVFFFLTGYGLMFSLMNKKDYLKSFVSRRLSKILIPAVIATVVYIAISAIAGEEINYNPIEIITGKGVIVSYSWFVYQIIIVYLVFYLVFRFIKSRKIGVIIFSLFTVADMLVFTLLGYELYWGIGIVCVALGVAFAYRYEEAVGFFKRYYYQCVAVFAIAFLGLFALMAMYLQEITDKNMLMTMCELLVTNASCIVFCILVFLALMKFTLANKATAFFGKISFELYLYHGLILTLVSRIESIPNPVIWIIVIADSVAVSLLANTVSSRMLKIRKAK